MTGRRKKKTNTATVGRPDDYQIEATEFGHLIWRVAGFLGNSTTMTVGECVIEPGKANGRHYHPNCDEILFVVKGHIRHTAGEEVVEMNAGDIISIPTGVVHNAANIGDQTAYLHIAFSSADRQTLGED